MLHLLVVGLTLAGQPEIADPRPTYGYLGAARPKGAGVLPGDIVSFSFNIKGLKVDEDGLSKYSVGILVKDGKDKIFYQQKPFNQIAQNLFGDGSVPTSATINVPLNQPPTDLNWTVTVKDRVTNKETELKGVGKVLPADFGIVRVGTFADAESKAPIAPVGVVGETFFLNFSAIGFGRDKEKRPDLTVELKILDSDKKQTHKPMIATLKDELPEDTVLIPLHFGLPLNRAGNFTVEMIARCNISNKTATVSLPFRVLAAE